MEVMIIDIPVVIVIPLNGLSSKIEQMRVQSV